MHLRYPGFLDYFFVEQHFRRYAQTGFNNVQPFWFFPPVLLLFTLPWSLWLAALLRRRALALVSPLGFYLWWVVAVVAFFSLPASKLVGYALPALAPLAAVLALIVARGRAWRWLLPAAAVACIGLVVVLGHRPADSHRDVAWALRALAAPNDRVAFIGEPYFDVPFYARLTAPPIVVADWDDPSIATHDDWRKELSDAARFAPDRGRRILLRTADLGRLRCLGATVWLLAPAGWQAPAALGPTDEAARDRRTVIHRVQAAPDACP
jgi:hypothetical protein